MLENECYVGLVEFYKCIVLYKCILSLLLCSVTHVKTTKQTTSECIYIYQYTMVIRGTLGYIYIKKEKKKKHAPVHVCLFFFCLIMSTHCVNSAWCQQTKHKWNTEMTTGPYMALHCSQSIMEHMYIFGLVFGFKFSCITDINSSVWVAEFYSATLSFLNSLKKFTGSQERA